jgi:hypothetical protein
MLNLIESRLEYEAQAQIFKRLRANTAGSISYSPVLSSIVQYSGFRYIPASALYANSRFAGNF